MEFQFQVHIMSQVMPKLTESHFCLISIPPKIHLCVNSRLPWGFEMLSLFTSFKLFKANFAILDFLSQYQQYRQAPFMKAPLKSSYLPLH